MLFRSEPIGQSTPATQTVCSDEAITDIVLSTTNGMDVGTTYAWSRDNTTNVTGLANNGTTDISGTPNNLTGVVQVVTYRTHGLVGVEYAQYVIYVQKIKQYT